MDILNATIQEVNAINNVLNKYCHCHKYYHCQPFNSTCTLRLMHLHWIMGRGFVMKMSFSELSARSLVYCYGSDVTPLLSVDTRCTCKPN